MNFLNLAKRFRNFNKDEDGAVTVDWVVLTAAVVGLGMLAMTYIKPGVSGLAGSIGGAMSGATVSVTIPGG